VAPMEGESGIYRIADRGVAALEAGIEPGSREAEPIVAEIASMFAAGEPGAPDLDAEDLAARDPGFRAELADRFEQGADPRAERYWQLLAVINGWPRVPTTRPAWRWTIKALRGGSTRKLPHGQQTC
jgi:hypothetical protein